MRFIASKKRIMQLKMNGAACEFKITMIANSSFRVCLMIFNFRFQHLSNVND